MQPEEQKRVSMTLKCLDSHSIPKVDSAGKVLSEAGLSVQLMHNGIKVVQGGYYGDWMSELIAQLKGHHEPQEELVFDAINRRAVPDGLMIELGCYWAYYSLWFLKDQPSRRAIGLEPDHNHLQIAQKNACLNNLDNQFLALHGLSSQVSQTSVAIRTESGQDLTLTGYTLEDLLALSHLPKIEIAHCDAQGAEHHVVDQIISLGTQQLLRFCVVSTHAYEITGDPLTHHTCLDKLLKAGAHIIAEHDVHESYSGDGLIAASFSPEDKDLQVAVSCNRYSTSLFPSPAFHLSSALNELKSLKNSMTRTPEKNNLALSRRQRIKNIFKRFSNS